MKGLKSLKLWLLENADLLLLDVVILLVAGIASALVGWFVSALLYGAVGLGLCLVMLTVLLSVKGGDVNVK